MSEIDTTVADDTSVSIDTTVDDAADTSTDDDVDLEDIEVNPEDMLDEDESEELKDEKKDTAPEKSEEESEGDEETDEDESKDDSKEESAQSDEEKQKAFNKQMAERRIQEKQQREQNQKAQQEEYLTQAEDEKDLALRQLQVDAYNNKIEGNTNKLTNGYEKAVTDFPILSSSDPVVRAEVDAALDAFQATSVTIDAYGNPIDVRGDLYNYLQRKADSIEKLTGIREVNQKNSKNKEKSKTFTPPSRTPKEPKVDDDMLAFDEEANKP